MGNEPKDWWNHAWERNDIALLDPEWTSGFVVLGGWAGKYNWLHEKLTAGYGQLKFKAPKMFMWRFLSINKCLTNPKTMCRGTTMHKLHTLCPFFRPGKYIPGNVQQHLFWKIDTELKLNWYFYANSQMFSCWWNFKTAIVCLCFFSLSRWCTF